VIQVGLATPYLPTRGVGWSVNMRMSVMVTLALLLATPVAAQEQQPPAPLADDALPSLSALSGAWLAVTPVALSNTQQPRAPQPPPPPPVSGRRRGSMVGYIADATVESKVRVRFDSAFENTVPDRAEFFYAKCGCYSDLPHTDPLFDPDAPGPKPGAANDITFQQLDFWGEYAFSEVVSVFVQLPVRWLQPQSFLGGGTGFSNQSGLGDIRAGGKVGFAPAADHQLTVQGQLFFPSGDAAKGLGTNHASIEPAVLYNWQASDTVIVESQFAVWLPFGGSAATPTSLDENFSGGVLTWGVGSGINLFTRGELAVGPVAELVGWHVMSGFETLATDASGTNIVNLKIGGRLAFDMSNSLYVGFGHALTDATWYDDIWRFEYRFGF